MPRRILLAFLGLRALAWLLPALPALAAVPPPSPPQSSALDRALDRAIALHQAGRLDEALREYHAVAAAGATDPAIAAAALSNACVIQNDRGDYRAALPDCRQALAQSRLLGDAGTLGRALNNLGLGLEALGETAEAEARFREALALNRRTGNAESEAINLSNLGTLALGTGRYTPAMDLQAQAAALAGRHAREPWAAEQLRIARINQGVVLDKVGAYREALELYRQQLGTGPGTAGGAGLDPGRRAALEVNAGVIYRNLGDPVRAVELFRAAIAGYRSAGDTAGLSNAHLNLALALHLNLERTAEAEAAYREALRLAEASGDRTEEIQDLFYLGRLLLGERRLPEAEGAFRRCLAAATASGSAEGRWSAREGLARVARAGGDLPAALESFEAALGEIEQVRAGLARGARRAGYFGDKRAVYAATVETLGELARRQPAGGWGERALGIAQRAKARDLLDALGAGGGAAAAAPLDAAALRARVESRGRGAVFEYFLGESDLYRWTIRAEGIGFRDLGPAAPILGQVTTLHRALSHGLAPPAGTVAALSRALLAGAGPLPPASRGGGALRIAPDGALHHLPFELLEDPAAPGAPLIERRAVSYLPSASALGREVRREKDGRAAGGVRLLGFGDPVVRRPAPAAGEEATPRALLVARFGLAPLPATGRELAAAGRLLGGRTAVYTGERATEGAFRAAVARGARVVHLATHAVIDERPGRGAAIVLTPGGGDDGLLVPEEIARLDDRSDLTVLAACRTALGPGEGGGALASLTGSFLAAGSRGVVATLWDVGDEATAAFMAQLYWQLGEGLSPAEALRAAKRRLRADPRWNRPSLWAAYVLVGDPPPLGARRRWGMWLAGIAAAALAALAALAVYRLARLARRGQPTGR